MHRLLHAAALALSVTGLAACAGKLPATTCEALGDFPGPEDFDLIEREGRVTILASASNRRDYEDGSQNGIWAIDPETREVTALAIHGRDSCWLAPHGIATVEVEPGRWELWSINHFRHEGQIPPDQTPECAELVHGIEHYRVEADGLHFIERITGPELVNPNELDVLPDGRLWLSNNPEWPGGKGRTGDVLLRRGTGQILHYAPGEGFTIAAEDFVYPNGIYADPSGESLWVSAAHGRIYQLGLDSQGHESSRSETKTKPRAILDNFLFADDALWVSGHSSGLAFLRHAKRSSAHSPTAAFRIETQTGEAELVGHWKRGEVDGGATVVPLAKQWVLSQVYEPGLRVCNVQP